MAELDHLIDEWETCVLNYDETTRSILRRIRLFLAQVPDDMLEEAMDDCSKFYGQFTVPLFDLAEFIALAEQILVKNLYKLDNDLNQLADSENGTDDSGNEANGQEQQEEQNE